MAVFYRRLDLYGPIFISPLENGHKIGIFDRRGKMGLPKI
jgi:hypothetical protein